MGNKPLNNPLFALIEQDMLNYESFIEKTYTLLNEPDSLEKLENLIKHKEAIAHLRAWAEYEPEEEQLLLGNVEKETAAAIKVIEATIERLEKTELAPKNDKIFKTNLTKEQRTELCNRILSNKGADSKTNKPIFKDIEEKHIPTLLYILGGDYPVKIEKIKVCSIGRTHEFLKSISTHPHPYTKNEICVPDFLKYALLKSDGNTILKLKK